jgi:hypothetical protein
MRRTAGLVLVGVGAFLLVLAVMIKVYAEPRVVTVPLDQSSGSQSRSDGNSASLDRGTLSVRTGLTLTANREVRGDVAAAKASGRDDVAVWNTVSSLVDGEGNVVSVTEETVAFDRVTGEAVDCCGEKVNGDESVNHQGLYLKFPFDTERKEYAYWDVTARRAFPMQFNGVESRNGLEVYHFVQNIPATELSRVEVPPSLVGATGNELIPATTVYTNTREVWVEPVSGIIVGGQENPRQTLRGDDGTDLLTVFESRIGFTPETEQRAADDAREAQNSLRLIRTVLPGAALGAGILLLAAGLALLFLRPGGGARRRAEGRRPGDPDRVLDLRSADAQPRVDAARGDAGGDRR